MPREKHAKNSRIWFLLKAYSLSTTINLNQNLKNDVFSETILAATIMQSLLKLHELFIYKQQHTIWGENMSKLWILVTLWAVVDAQQFQDYSGSKQFLTGTWYQLPVTSRPKDLRTYTLLALCMVTIVQWWHMFWFYRSILVVLQHSVLFCLGPTHCWGILFLTPLCHYYQVYLVLLWCRAMCEYVSTIVLSRSVVALWSMKPTTLRVIYR